MLLALAAAAGLGPAAARADVLLGANFSGLDYRLTDLRPDDGSAAAMSLDGNIYSLRAEVADGPSRPGGGAPRSAYVDKSGVFQDGMALYREVSGARNQASFGLSGSFQDGGLNMFVGGKAGNVRSSPQQSSWLLLYSHPAFHLAMTLAPYTQVTWSGKITVEAAQTLGRHGARYEEGWIEGGAYLKSPEGEYLDAAVNSVRINPGAVDSRRSVQDIDMSFSNLSAAPRQILLYTFMSGEGKSFFPVPEPGTPWLMLCGVGVLAGTAGLRRRAIK
ncbi:PEP-CTERM sorting domain-containing protein [Azohydromonas caseinilytica]|uniref:PEP-CTERM sorting domain-containing protein n=1 Tax=Azohydromonas caseinilytica TaxID=2728836 RepID=A0A848F9T4_9BURK|nr:PEP-CTERM sorting domain-containing protein [Azohydromonas caseinilytica]NML16018.1 PEP-CTERM sorting domain-containing protein [Azohydromonas caseinilytica]